MKKGPKIHYYYSITTYRLIQTQSHQENDFLLFGGEEQPDCGDSDPKLKLFVKSLCHFECELQLASV